MGEFAPRNWRSRSTPPFIVRVSGCYCFTRLSTFHSFIYNLINFQRDAPRGPRARNARLDYRLVWRWWEPLCNNRLAWLSFTATLNLHEFSSVWRSWSFCHYVRPVRGGFTLGYGHAYKKRSVSVVKTRPHSQVMTRNSSPGVDIKYCPQIWLLRLNHGFHIARRDKCLT